MFPLFLNHPILKIVSANLVTLPSPSRISGWWNFGSLLGMCLTTQLLTGILLAIHYTGRAAVRFDIVSQIANDANGGWLLRTIHANRARFFFFCLYFHVGRGLYYHSYSLELTWRAGSIILLITMATAFLGYVLPWGQISFWGTSVITRLLTAIPWIGEDVVIWLWGGFAVGNATLVRFYAFHYLCPFIISALAVIHLLFLHQPGSSNPLGMNSNKEKCTFHPFFSWKDLAGFAFIALLLLCAVLYAPWNLGDSENFILANTMVTPIHIQPEWYFLFAYAILRSIPNKLGGVVALALSVIILLLLPFLHSARFRAGPFCPPAKLFFWSLVICARLLTWIGARPVEEPYVILGQIFTVFYFTFFLSYSKCLRLWNQAL
mgnify:CR=1 FL=1